MSVAYDIVITMLGLTLALFIYTLPSFIAYVKDHKNFVKILTVNVLFGFLIFPWLVMLIYATFTHPTKQPS